MLGNLNENFDNLIYAIGGIPASYLKSLSYEEQLLWLCKNLKELMDNVNEATSIENYEELITLINGAEKDEINIGQIFCIQSSNVPDLWVSSVSDTKEEYTYTNDTAIINNLKNNGFIKVGYYTLMAIEGLVDLTNYVTNTDYATSIKGGVIKTGRGFGLDNGIANAVTFNYSDYLTYTSNIFISKGTLENVIAGKNLESANNKVTSISASSTDTEYPSAKCVYDIVGNIESLLESI